MGFNTIMMFRNDAYGDFEINPNETMENILKGMNNVPSEKHHYGVGSHANPMVVMKPRHMDDTMIYVHCGNTLVEMSTHNKETEDLMDNHPEFFKEMLDHMEHQVKRLKEISKNKKNESTI